LHLKRKKGKNNGNHEEKLQIMIITQNVTQRKREARNNSSTWGTACRHGQVEKIRIKEKKDRKI
jgi:hypothetical protein